MGELEPSDSRDVTGSNATAPGEPPRTGPREDEARAAANQTTAGERDRQRQAQAGGDFATEGDGPDHPDRTGTFVDDDGVHHAAQAEQQSEEEAGDRWHQKAQAAQGETE